MEKKIMDIMTRGVVTARVDSSVRQVARAMIEDNVSVVVVVDEQSQACGVISKSDILKYRDKDIDAISAEDIMSPKIYSLPPSASLSEATGVLLEKKIHQLVIMKEDPLERRKPVGILTIPDLIKEMLGIQGRTQYIMIPHKMAQEVFNLGKNYWMTTMEMMSAFQDQNEKMWNTFLEQGSISQQEGGKMLQEWLNRAKQIREQFQKTMGGNL